MNDTTDKRDTHVGCDVWGALRSRFSMMTDKIFPLGAARSALSTSDMTHDRGGSVGWYATGSLARA
jgi:hypothetical protein